MKKKTKTEIVLFACCAGVWLVVALLDILFLRYRYTPTLCGLHLVCAVLAVGLFLSNFKKYLAGK